MTNELKTYHIPEQNLQSLTERIDQLNKKATKLNCQPITIITHGHEDRELTNSYGKKTGQIQRYIIIEVIGEAPSLNSWQFIASIESRSAGNLIKSIPNELIPEKYRQSFNCDHCQTDRQRVYTYLVKNLETAEIKQVGKSCLKDFLGHQNPENIANWFSYISELDEMINEFCSYSGNSFRIETLEYLEFVSACIRENGWISRTIKSKKAEEGEFVEATCDFAMQAREAFYKPVKDRKGNILEFPKPTEKDQELAEKSLEWAKSLTTEQTKINDYLYNINILSQEQSLNYKDIGFVASIVSSYIKNTEKQIEKERQEKLKTISDYIGKPGEKLNLELTLVNTFGYETQYGYTRIYKFLDNQGNVIIWKTSNYIEVSQGEKITIKGTIKEHNEYAGEKQTILTRCKVQ